MIITEWIHLPLESTSLYIYTPVIQSAKLYWYITEIKYGNNEGKKSDYEPVLSCDIMETYKTTDWGGGAECGGVGKGGVEAEWGVVVWWGAGVVWWWGWM